MSWAGRRQDELRRRESPHPQQPHEALQPGRQSTLTHSPRGTPGGTYLGQTQSLSTHSSIQPAHATDMHSAASVTYTVNFPEAHSPLSIWYVHTLTCIGSWTHTVTHWCAVPLGGPHTLLHRAVCVSAAAFHRLRQSSSGHSSHPDGAIELGQEH